MQLLHYSKRFRQDDTVSSIAVNDAPNGMTPNTSNRFTVASGHSYVPKKAIGSFIALSIVATAGVLFVSNTLKSAPISNTDSQLPTVPSLATSNVSDLSNGSSQTPSATQDNSSNPSQTTETTGNNDISTDVSVTNSSNNPSKVSTEMSVNGQPVTVPNNGSTTEHTSTVSSPNQSTSFNVTSTRTNSGSASGFSSSNEDLFVNSSTITQSQEGD